MTQERNDLYRPKVRHYRSMLAILIADIRHLAYFAPMKERREIWFTPSAIRGFGAVHWKGPLFIIAMAFVGASAGLAALANEVRHPVLAVLGAAVAVGAVIIGSYVCSLHTGNGG